MISCEELNTQNHELIELSNVLNYLLKDRSMCDTDTCCELFYRFMERFKAHMEVVDNDLYGPLLTHPENGIANTARNFMSGGRDIRHIMDAYKKRWCQKPGPSLAVGQNYERFVQETDELFEMVTSRIQHETERLYPLVRDLGGDAARSAH